MIVYRGVNQLVDIDVDNRTVLAQKLLGENIVKANFTLSSFVDFQLGDHINWAGGTYSINKQPQVEKKNARQYNYNIFFYGEEYAMDNALFLLDGKADFFLNGDIDQFISLIVSNLNRVAGSTIYAKGSVPSSSGYKNISFSGETCLNVLKKVCIEFELEYEITNAGKTISVVESVGNQTSLTFQFKTGLRGITRREIDDSSLVTRLYAYGGDRNVTNDYGFHRLRMASPHYLENNVNLFGTIERVVIFDEIYPRRNSSLTAVNGTDELKFTDANMDFDLNDQLTSSNAKITFNTGQLAGYEFEIANYNHATKEFTVIRITDAQELSLPNATLKPGVGDEYVLHDIEMPASYIASAEAELLTKATSYLNGYSLPNVIYEIAPDKTYFRNNVISLQVGDTITIQDTEIGVDLTTRILELTQSVGDQFVYTIKVGDRVTINYINRVLNGVLSNSNSITLEKRDRTIENVRLRNAYNNLSGLPDLIFDEEGYFDPTKIKPLSVETGFLSVGAKPLQMNFNDLQIELNYQGNKNRIRISNSTLIHFTIEDTIKTWTVTGSVSNLPDDDFRYLYIKASRTLTTAVWHFSQSQLSVDSESTTYTFLVAVIHQVDNNVRGISQLYGQTYINGRFITTGRVQSVSGDNYFDLDANQFNLGDANNGMDYNVTNANALTIRGSIFQNAGGDSFPALVYRGSYQSATTYYQGDIVSYNGSTYVKSSSGTTINVIPTNTSVWDLYTSAGSDGNDGNDGNDGADAINAITIPYAPALIGGSADFVFTLNQTAGGSSNVGEIRIQGSKFDHPGLGEITLGYTQTNILTPYGEGAQGRFYVIYSQQLFRTRVSQPGNTQITDNNFIPIRIVSNSWQAFDNAGVNYPITLVATDVFLFASEAEGTTGGLTSLIPFVGSKGNQGDPGNDGADGADGNDGADGADGATGPALVFRGNFSNGTTYYNFAQRRDVVYHNSTYYLYNISTTSSGNVENSFNSNDWINFGANFEAVATNLLLAESANIADMIINNGRITSADSDMVIYGPKGVIIWNTVAVNGTAPNTRIGREGFFVSSNGVDVNQPTTAYDAEGNPVTTITLGPVASIVGKAKHIGSSLRPSIGVYGETENQGDNDWGGWFWRCFVKDFLNVDGGVSFKARRGGTTTLGEGDFWYTATATATVFLPNSSNRSLGQIFFVKRQTGSTVTLNGNGGSFWWKSNAGTTENIRSIGMTIMLVWDGAYWQYSELFQ